MQTIILIKKCIIIWIGKIWGQIFRKIFPHYFVQTLILVGTDHTKNVTPNIKETRQLG